MKNFKIHAHRMHLFEAVGILINGKKCEECEFRSMRRYDMQAHIRKIHDKEVKFSCSDCKFKTFYKNVFKKHQHRKHNILFEKNIWYDHENICKFCKASALTTREIAKHMLIKHPKERLFDCGERGYRSNWMNNIRVHRNGKHRKTELVCNNVY